MTTILLVALAGAVLAAVVGSFWYSNATPMGRLHMKYLGFDKLSDEEKKTKMKEAMPGMPKVYAGQLALSFLTSLSVAFIITMSMKNGVPFKMAILFPVANWLCFIVPTVGQSILWGNCDRKIAWKKFFSDSASNLVTILLISLLSGFFA